MDTLREGRSAIKDPIKIDLFEFDSYARETIPRTALPARRAPERFFGDSGISAARIRTIAMVKSFQQERSSASLALFSRPYTVSNE